MLVPQQTDRDITAALAAAVRALRQAQGLSQAELGRRAGCDRLSVLRLEAGKHSPTFILIGRLTAALGLTLTQLATEVDRHLKEGTAP